MFRKIATIFTVLFSVNIFNACNLSQDQEIRSICPKCEVVDITNKSISHVVIDTNRVIFLQTNPLDSFSVLR